MILQVKNMDNFEISDELFLLADSDYKKFMSSLLPSVEKNRIIGVRTPLLRKIARRISKSGKKGLFLECVPHKYYEENNIHAFVIAELDYEECIKEINSFLPFVDNWATCDGLRPKSFYSHRDELISEILTWLKSEHVYTVRFAIEMLMLHFLGEDFKPEFFEMVAAVRTEEYYLNMMIAWYFATALAERYEDALPYLEEKRLSVWVHNKTVSKAIESYRIPLDRKKHLETLRIKDNTIKE